MRTLRSGYMYSFPIESGIYAAMPWRRWWTPWRWNLDVYRWGHDDPRTAGAGAFHIARAETIATNITKAECIGLMKLLGYPEEIKC